MWSRPPLFTRNLLKWQKLSCWDALLLLISPKIWACYLDSLKHNYIPSTLGAKFQQIMLGQEDILFIIWAYLVSAERLYLSARRDGQKKCMETAYVGCNVLLLQNTA